MYIWYILHTALTSYSSWDMSIFGIVAAILDVLRPLTSDSSSINIIELPDFENMGEATGILMLSSLQTEWYTFG